MKDSLFIEIDLKALKHVTIVKKINSFDSWLKMFIFKIGTISVKSW